MIKCMNAAEYAKYSGYPLVTIKKYCKAGIIPSDRVGRKYLINVELADRALLERMQKPPDIKKEEVTPKATGKGETFDFLAALNKIRTG